MELLLLAGAIYLIAGGRLGELKLTERARNTLKRIPAVRSASESESGASPSRVIGQGAKTLGTTFLRIIKDNSGQARATKRAERLRTHHEKAKSDGRNAATGSRETIPGAPWGEAVSGLKDMFTGHGGRMWIPGFDFPEIPDEAEAREGDHKPAPHQDPDQPQYRVSPAPEKGPGDNWHASAATPDIAKPNNQGGTMEHISDEVLEGTVVDGDGEKVESASRWTALTQYAQDLEFENDQEIGTFLREETAGLVAYAEAIAELVEKCVTEIGLDPVSMEGLVAYGEPIAEAGERAAEALRKFITRYQAVIEFTENGGVLPHDGRFFSRDAA